MSPYRSPPPSPRPRWRPSRNAILAAIIGAVALAAFAFRKRVDPSWTRLDVGDRAVHSLATAPDGRLFVGTERHEAGDVLVSNDRGTTFRALALSAQPIWRVQWLPRAQLACAAGRAGLFCGNGDSMEPVLRGVDAYFATETRDGVLTGGHPLLYVGDRNAQNFEPSTRVSYAVTDAVVVGERVYRGGDGLYQTDAGGREIRRDDFEFGVRVLAANGSRVYAAGGSFGASFARSDDGGEHWRDLPFPGSQPEAMVVHPNNADVVFVGTHGDLRRGDVYLSIDGGVSWRALGCPGAEVHGVAIDSEFVYCGATALMGNRGLWRRPLAGLVTIPNAARAAQPHP